MNRAKSALAVSLERGLTAPSFETIAALAKALRVAPAVLFGAEPTEVTGERREVLERINYLLLSSSDPDVKRAERVLVALMRND
jgi:hypothetical protein